MHEKALDTFRSYKREAESLVSKVFEGQEKRDVTFLLTCTLMAKDQLKERQRIERFVNYTVEHQEELLALAHEFDSAVTSFNQTATVAVNPDLSNTISVRKEDKLGSGKIPLLLGEGAVRPKEAFRQIKAGQRAFDAQNMYMKNSEFAQNDKELYDVIHNKGSWSEIHLNAKSPKHFLATFIIDLYPGMLRRTGMYGPELDTDELVRALCENLDPESEFFKLIKDQSWFEDEDFSPAFRKNVTSKG